MNFGKQPGWLELPEREWAPFTSSSLQYGAGKVAAAHSCLGKVPSEIRGVWAHGWTPDFFCDIDPLYAFGDSLEKDQIAFVGTKCLERYLVVNGYPAKAIGLPIAYLPDRKYRRKERSLLVMPTHSLDYTKHSWKFDEYAQQISEIKKDFDEVWACIHTSCIKNGYWVRQFQECGIPVIEGVHANDRNSLERIRALASQFEFITTNGFGSHIAYGSAFGAKVSIFGKFSEFRTEDYSNCPFFQTYPGMLERAQKLNSPIFLKSQLHGFFSHPREAEERVEWGLEGIPIGIKDTFNTADLPTQMGSPLWKNFTPGNDARVVYEARRTGGLVAGKTVTAEFAVHALNETLNPHDITRTPGTSSSGSAVAISLGIVPVALGSQTAGSIIRPASFCGVYGFKPSFGTIARTGTLKTTDSLDTLGFFTASPKDIRLVFDQLRVRGRDYPYVHRYLDNNERAKRDVYDFNNPRIGFARTYTWSQANGYAREAIEKFCHGLSSMGCRISDMELPAEFEEVHQLHSDIYNFSLAYYFKQESISHEKISSIMKVLIDKGNKIPFSRYQKALQLQEKLCKEFDQLASEFDVILSLSTAGSAPLRHIEEDSDPSLLWNFLHLPAASAPVFKCPAGLPFGLQIFARRFNDYRILDFLEKFSESSIFPVSPTKIA